MNKTREICQSHLGVAPWMDPLAARLPGLQPVQPGEWLQRDDAFGGQMAYREALLADRRSEVLGGQAEPDQASQFGGGAFLEFVEGKVLPAVEVLEQRAKG